MADQNTFDQLTLIVGVRRGPAFDAPNLLESTLAPATATPFRPVEWVVPRRAPRSPEGFAQARPAYYSEGKPPHQDEWPTPVRWRQPITFDPPSLLQGTLAPAVVTRPFSQAEWPVVVRLTRPTQTIAQARPAYYSEGKPQKQDEWVTPGAWRRPITFDPPNLLHGTLTPAVVVMPFSQSEWPVVLKPRRPTDTIAQGRPAYYDEGKPVHQDEWPAPRRLARVVPFDPPALVQSTLSGTQTPFALLEWSVPMRRQAARAFDAVNLPLSTLLPPPPIRMLDWPLPRRAVMPALSWMQGRPFFYAEPTETAVPLSLLGSYVAALDQRGSYRPTIDLRGSKG
jgi:hypothetical protein